MSENKVLNEKEELVQVQFYYTPFIIDCVARWLILGVYRSLSSNIQETSDFNIFVAANILITIFTITFVLVHSRMIHNRFTFIKERNYETKVDIFAILFVAFVIFSVNYILIDVIRQQDFYIQIAKREGAGVVIPTVTIVTYSMLIMILSLLSITVPAKYRKKFQKTGEEEKTGYFENFISGFQSKSNLRDAIAQEDSLAPIDEYDYDIDKNDTQIVKLEGHLKNETSRVDAYILESVLFGALAFSAFLTIISSERFNLTKSEYIQYLEEEAYGLRDDRDRKIDLAKAYQQKLESSANTTKKDSLVSEKKDTVKTTAASKKTELAKKEVRDAKTDKSHFLDSLIRDKRWVTYQVEIELFWDNLKKLFQNTLLFNFKEVNDALGELIKPRNLVMLIMFETLFCSLFFVSVIAARIRYSNIAEEIDNLIRLARTFNDKEEEVYNLSLQVDQNSPVKDNLEKRLTALSKAINMRIERAEEFTLQTKPIVFYMTLLRNSGVFTFILILITSSLFFSTTLATIFLVFSVMAYIYESLDGRLRVRRVRKAVDVN